MPRPSSAPGLSLVELMVALAVGLFIVAAATTLLAAQLADTRSVAQEVRLLQDLRTVADLMTRDLRRAGHWGRAGAGVWQPGGSLPVAANPYAGTTLVGPDGVGLRYSRDAAENDVVDANEQFGYRLRSGVLELQLGAGNWQALSDPLTMTVTAFDVTATADAVDLAGSCIAACPAGATDCPPRHRLQHVSFSITARSATDPRIVRTLRGGVRQRNDLLSGACPAV